jgi:hypothetical protein
MLKPVYIETNLHQVVRINSRGENITSSRARKTRSAKNQEDANIFLSEPSASKAIHKLKFVQVLHSNK